MNIQSLAEKILKTSHFVLSTHKNCDADGLGSMMAMHLALKNLGKSVQSLTVDQAPPRYDFMNHQEFVHSFEKTKSLEPAELALIFDTNDPKMLEPLYPELQKKCKEIIFIDHHSKGETPEENHFIQSDAASTGEMAYFLLKEMGIKMDSKTAGLLYTSIIFDTRMFRSSKNLAKAFEVCSHLCSMAHSNTIYENLFCTYDEKTWKKLLVILQKMKSTADNKIGWLELSYEEFKASELKMFHLLDGLDSMMRIGSLVIGFLSIEKQPNLYKISLRSKGSIDVHKIASSFGGGGHARSAGMTIKDYSQEKLLEKLQAAL